MINIRTSLRQDLILLMVVSGLLGSTATGQTTAARPDRGIMATGSYSVSDIENVNLTNGNNSVSIPLAALPPMAGGKLSWTLRAVYNSKLWDAKMEERQDNPYDPVYAVSLPQISENGGWKLGTYNITVRLATDDYAYIANSQDPEYQNLLLPWAKITLNTPDGAQHELRPLDYWPYQGSHEYLEGYFKDGPNNTGSPMRYYSFDGSFLWVKINPSSYSTRWEVYLPDGTKVVEFSSGIQRITDTNGNSIKIYTEDDGSGVSTTHYQDEQTPGREIKYVYNPAGQGTAQVLYQTVEGGWVATDLTFGTTVVQGKVYDVTNPYCTYQEPMIAEYLPVIREIILPQTEPGVARRKFTFTYNSDTTDSTQVLYTPYCSLPWETLTTSPSHGWGSLSRMVTPQGATANYTYSLDGINNVSAEWTAGETIFTKTLVHDNLTDSWSYNISPTSGSVTGPDGSVTTESFYFHSSAYASIYGGSNGLAGLVYKTNQSGKVLTERQWVRLKFDGAQDNAPGALLVFNAVVAAEYTSLLEGNPAQPVKMSAKTYQHDFNGNVIQQTDYDWFDPALVSRDAQGVPTGVPPVCVPPNVADCAMVLRVTNNSYHNPATSSSSGNVYAKRLLATGTPLILSALQQTTLGPTINQTSTTTQLSYDLQAYGTAPNAGNLTSQSIWDDVDNKWITSSQTYALYGNLATKTDARGKVTQFFFDDATHALPNRVVVDPQNGTGTQTTTIAYDYSTGLITSQTDPNGNVSTVDYTNQLLPPGTIDPFGRPGVVYGPDLGGGVNHRTRTFYADNARTVTVLSDLNTEGDGLLKSQAISDMLGRTIESRQYENASDFIAVRKSYDIPNRLSKTSNPFRAGEAVVWTTAVSDFLGRVVSVTTPDNAVVSTSYNANSVTVTDQAGKQRKSVSNALGQLTSVFEDPNGLNYQTSYDYDVLGNLRHVYQGAQTRTFTYDSLSRLRTAQNPESGTITYTYDDNGNLLTKVDARSITSNYVYDSLNRVTSRTYSDGTPAVTYVYDTLSQNGKGRLTSVSSSVSTYSYSGYDAMGRVLGGSQAIGSKTYPIGYTYHLASQVKSMTYPSGHTVNYGNDNAGRLISFSGNLGEGGASRNYATAMTYSSLGGMTEEKYGTDIPLYNKRHYNVRGQLFDNRLSTVPWATDEWAWDRGAILNWYDANTSAFENRHNSGPDNNGNVRRSQSYTVLPGGGQTYYTDDYAYDSLNRLESINAYRDGAHQFIQAYIYDRYGNRTINAALPAAGINKKQFTVNTANNRLGVGVGQSGTMTYDNAGNLTTDTYSGWGLTRAYDAENRMTQETQTNQTASYGYDGDGRRVKRTTAVTGQPVVETWQVYGLGGELLAEYAANAVAATPQKEYGYRNGQLLVTAKVTAAGWGPQPVINDNPLDLNVTTIQARHITELRSAIDALRSHHNLSPFPWQYSATTNDWISANPIIEMRTALDAALGAPSPAYSAGLGLDQPIKKDHIQELRDRVLAAWNSGSGAVDIRWLVADHLGTPRMIFDQSGSLAGVKRHDYLPFGEELFQGAGGRTLDEGYTGSGVLPVDGARQKFTAKERDNETGLDFFDVRHYSSLQGRFVRPDQPFNDQEEYDPQSWNLYSYVRNNPLAFLDPSGLARVDANGNWIGEKDGECDKGLGACWRADPKRELGGYWDFGGNQSPVTVTWSGADQAALDATISENNRRAARESDPDCEDCVMEMGGGRLIAQAVKTLVRGRPTSRLDRALRTRGAIRGFGTHAHHIVASGARRASLARRILRRFKLDVDGAENGVYLPSSVHRGVHTNRYYEKVEQLLRAAATKEDAVAILSYIGSELQKGTFVSSNPKFPF